MSTIRTHLLAAACVAAISLPADTRAAAPLDALHQHVTTSDTLTGDWFGARTALSDAGIDVGASLILDSSKTLAGGLDTEGSSTRHLFDLNVTFDTEKLLGLEGGTVFVDFYTHAGPDGSADDAGDAQAFSNIDAPERTQLAELWYEQWLFDQLVRIKIGKVEANSEFAFADNGGEFLNSSAGCSPTIQGLPTYPDPATSVNIFVYPIEGLYIGFGLYDGAAQEGKPLGKLGPKTFFGRPADLFLIGEAGISWDCGDSGLGGRFAIGGWGHTGHFDHMNGSGDTIHGTQGIYLTLEHQLWLENAEAEGDDQGISAFVMFGAADQDAAMIDRHVAVGAQWIGPIPTRDADACGLFVSWAQFSDTPGAGFTDDRETAIEMFYKVQVTPWFSVKPDLQYITNPGGAGLDDAVVGAVRLEIVF